MSRTLKEIEERHQQVLVLYRQKIKVTEIIRLTGYTEAMIHWILRKHNEPRHHKKLSSVDPEMKLLVPGYFRTKTQANGVLQYIKTLEDKPYHMFNPSDLLKVGAGVKRQQRTAKELTQQGIALNLAPFPMLYHIPTGFYYALSFRDLLFLHLNTTTFLREHGEEIKAGWKDSANGFSKG